MGPIFNENSSIKKNIEVIEDENDCYFKITCTDHDSRILCERTYTPVLNLKERNIPADNKSKDSYKDYFYKLFDDGFEESCEEDIYQVWVKSVANNGEEKIRIGWIFPIQALFSEVLTTKKNNRYFLNYAYMALYLLLNDVIDEELKHRKESFLDLDGPLDLKEYFQEDIDKNKSILVLSKENTEKIKDFKLSEYTLGFFKYGYEENGCRNFNSQRRNDEDKLWVTKISEDLKDTDTIQSFLIALLPMKSQQKTHDEVIRFHVCYQIIELMITKVFENELKNIIDELSQNPENLFDKREDLSNITAEKERIKRLFHKGYVNCDITIKREINQHCKDFLIKTSNKFKEDDNDFYYNLYSVRCFLVHKLYRIDDGCTELLRRINKSFLDLVIEVLTKFNMNLNNS